VNKPIFLSIVQGYLLEFSENNTVSGLALAKEIPHALHSMGEYPSTNSPIRSL
jgi:hypothetical protein